MFLNRAVTVAALVGGFLAIIISFIFGGGSVLFALLAAFLFTVSVLTWKYGYLFIPMITKATNVVEIRDGGYEVPPSRDYILKKTPSGYYSTKFMEIRYYESSMDKGEEEKRTMFEAFEKAISSLRYIVKISLLISAIDLSKHIDDIKTRRSKAETQRAAEGRVKADELIKYDREIAMWNRLLDRLGKGERPVEVIAFGSTTAFGLTREEAVSRVSRQSKEVRTVLSSSMGCDIRELKDLEMLKCFEWELFFPTSEEELKDEIF
ncbi:hypothetical protein H0O02_02435 [Candidatus Micrarchaeota archaeon]|nr:hypothetical protein [Candidatus Micrarchaeota archaeon]